MDVEGFGFARSCLLLASLLLAGSLLAGMDENHVQAHFRRLNIIKTPGSTTIVGTDRMNGL